MEVFALGKAKIVNYYNNRYRGSLTEEECDKLDYIIQLDKENGCFDDLRHIVYELSDSDTARYIEGIDTGLDLDYVPDRRIGTLRDEQTLGTAFMFFAGSCILGDSVGMGKTPQVAGLCRILENIYRDDGKQFRYLLLTEKTLIEKTRFKMVKFTGEYAINLGGDAPACNKFKRRYPANAELPHSIVGGHTLLNQGIFIDWVKQYESYHGKFPFDLIIVDESSVLGNLSTAISKNAKVLFSFVDRVVFLNATPFESKLDTFYSQLELLDSKLLPTKTNFQKEYVVYDYRGMYPRPTGRYKNQANFKNLVGYRYFARTRKDKGAVMEDCSGRLMVSPLSPIQKVWLKRTQMPQMVYDCPNCFDPDIDFNVENVPKLASLSEALRVDCADAQSVLIFVHYREAQDSLSLWLENEGYSNRVLCGDTKETERNEIITGFENNEFKVLITNVQKGLDFGDCDYCIFYSFDPNPSKMIQFEGRITRSFDIINKHIILLCSEGRELDRLNKVIRKRAEASQQFTKTDLSCIMELLIGEN